MIRNEWLALKEERKQKEREKHKVTDKNRARKMTIVSRTTEKDRTIIFSKIALLGLNRQDYMTNIILHVPIEVVSTKNVIYKFKEELRRIVKELSRLEKFSDLNNRSYEMLIIINEIMKASIKQEKSTQ
ncbi:plasmid mobilization protein [Clostridioides difficile]|uniref:plasmid mobilization protein n=1 Tax=Clostridioides difficile TaxID=1496 RepID=UPI00097FF9C2|nr:hypothetical protein [Clostridioides difficile]SJO96715.1 Uncharacterised protein [Clostridioides difficile]